MTAQTQRSDPEDPLEGYSGLTLFPRTLASIPNAPKPYDPHDLHRVHNFLKSMTLPNPNTIVEEAEAVVDCSSGLAGSEIPSYLISEYKNEHVAARGTENPQERRPALGRKRARFSLKPNSSRPTVNLETSLDIGKLKDPEQFFLAFEKIENARKELQKQTGGDLMDLNLQNSSMAARPRRPGILRRSVKYKHRYSDVLSSQETLEENILSPSGYSVQQETINPDDASLDRELVDAALQETELADSIAKSEKKVNDLLDELLSDNCGGLDGDDPVSLLQEHLQIKPIDLEKLSLPELQAVRRIDLKASGANLPKPRHVLSDIQNLLKGVSSKTPKKCQQAESPVSSLASPTPAKCPLSSIVSLKKRILRLNPLTDPYSAHEIDQSIARNLLASESIKKQADQVNTEKELSASTELKSSMIEESDAADMNLGLPHGMMGNAPRSSDKTVNDSLSRLGYGVGVGSSGSHAYVENKNSSSCMENRIVNEILGRPDTVTDFQTTVPNGLDDKVHEKDTLQEAGDLLCPDLNMEDSTVEILNSTQDQENTPVVEDRATDGLSNIADTDREQHKEKAQIATEEPLNDQNRAKSHPRKKSKLKKVSHRKNLAANHPVVEDHATDGSSNTAETAPEQQNKEVLPTGEPLNEQSKVISRPGKKSRREEISRRQSLAASGTSWESGTRRSTRIKSRPLEYWKGERFLYGRVHQSLTTVIGIKYASPGTNDGKPTIKVKSYVSDQYKDLVDLAARF
ncbi:centromere protein C [Pistacia vera]|uniref:centromere protein C n=1 Tax=Pistacia vera TaxID=55513 RepID=UPI00126391D8|nr:centromere protein C [Pistacia vera]